MHVFIHLLHSDFRVFTHNVTQSEQGTKVILWLDLAFISLTRSVAQASPHSFGL